MSKTGGGPGSNQYGPRGDPLKRHKINISKPQITLDQQPHRCGEVWGGACQAWVHGPSWSHGKHPDVQSREDAATYESTPAAILDRLAEDEHDSVRRRVAWNRNTSPDTLAKLIRDHQLETRLGVARRTDAHPDTLAALGSDMNVTVRYALTKNPNTPAETLAKLARDSSNLVRAVAATNPNLPREDLLDLILNDPDPEVRKAAYAAAPESLQAAVRLAE